MARPIIRIERNLIKIGDMYYSDLRMGGKRVRRALSIYKPKALKLLADLISFRQIQKHGGAVENMPWYVFKMKYVAHRRSSWSLRTNEHDDRAIRQLEQVYPNMLRLNQITPELLDDAKQRWEKAGMGPYAIAKAMRVIKTMMKQAETWKYIPMQDWRSVKIRKDRKRVIYYTVEEFKKLLRISKGHWKTATMLMGRAGLRPAEARHLEWSDINFKDRIIHIRIKEDWKPKSSTEESPHERVVDMTPDLEAHLKSLPARVGFVLGRELVNEHSYRQYFQRLAKKAKLPGFAYAFRHTYASHLISSGSTLPEVGALLGQTDYRSTAIYSHLLPHARRTAVDRLPSIG